MNRRDLPKFIALREILEKSEMEGGFSFFSEEITEDLAYK